jgi:hypothetical protein
MGNSSSRQEDEIMEIKTKRKGNYRMKAYTNLSLAA